MLGSFSNTHFTVINRGHLKSMCDAFNVACTQTTIERYTRPSMVHVTFKLHLNLLIQRYPLYWYLDKLWVVQKGLGIGTRCFQEFLACSTKPLIWRTNKDNLRNWYLTFQKVKEIVFYQGYWYFTHSHCTNFNWSFEDIHVFNHPSYTNYTQVKQE